MPYTTTEELIEQYGEDALSFVADRDNDFLLDHAKIVEAIKGADAEIDSYIGVKYSLPLPSIPRILAQRSREIAVYLMATAGGALTDNIEIRYKAAVEHLKRMADGKATLVLEEPPRDEDGDGEPDDAEIRSSGPRPIVASGEERLFSREKMRGF